MKLVKSISIFLLLATATLSLQAQSAADEQAIRTLMNEGLDAYYKGDINKMIACYAENAVVIDWMGNTTTGRDALRASTEKALQYEKPNADNFKASVNNVRFLHPDVAVVQLDLNGVTTVDGKPQPWKGVNAMVFVRKNGKWLIEQEQNTPVFQMPGN